mgnify:CR=1 FL=1
MERRSPEGRLRAVLRVYRPSVRRGRIIGPCNQMSGERCRTAVTGSLATPRGKVAAWLPRVLGRILACS